MSSAEVKSLEDALELVGSRKIAYKIAVSGGDINESYRIALENGNIFFLKANRNRDASFFKCEYEGLKLIKKSGCISVPNPIAYGVDKEKKFAFLLMENINSAHKQEDYYEKFGQTLALLHKQDFGQDGFGLDIDNYIGSTKQKNTYKKSWIDFFRTCRLEYQFNLASEYFDREDKKKVNSLLDNLDKYLQEPEKPSLIHGDLWSGNYITGSDGYAWLIDPAVSFSHSEADIAMTELFGGFDIRFYDAYKEASGMSCDYKDRRDLYNLYHLLNHLNLFGASYLGSVKSIVRRYS